MPLYMPMSPYGQPGSVLGSSVVGGHVIPQSKGILCSVIDPNGHKLDLPSHIYSVDKWGHISPAVTCKECGWSETVYIESPDD